MMSKSKAYSFVMIRLFAIGSLAEEAGRVILGYKAPQFMLKLMVAELQWRNDRRAQGKWPDA